MTDILSSEADSLNLPIVTRLVPPDMGAALDLFCRELEAAAQGQAPDQSAVSNGLQTLLNVSTLPPAPVVPGVPWMGLELADRDGHGSVLRVESARGEGLTIHRDAAGIPTVATWERAGTEQAATFFLTQGVGGWELGVENGTAIARYPVTLPSGIAWAPAVGSGTLAAVVTTAVGAVVAGLRAAPSTEVTPSHADAAPLIATQPASVPAARAVSPSPVESFPPSDAVPPSPEPESVSWHYLYDGQSQGPVAEATLRAWLAEGRLQPDTLVWNASFVDWRSAQEAGLAAPAFTKLFCGQCGTQLSSNARFCGGCGSAVG